MIAETAPLFIFFATRTWLKNLAKISIAENTFKTENLILAEKKEKKYLRLPRKNLGQG